MFHGFMDFVPQFLDLSRFLEVPSFLRLACHHSEKFSIHQILCKDQLVILIQWWIARQPSEECRTDFPRGQIIHLLHCVLKNLDS